MQDIAQEVVSAAEEAIAEEEMKDYAPLLKEMRRTAQQLINVVTKNGVFKIVKTAKSKNSKDEVLYMMRQEDGNDVNEFTRTLNDYVRESLLDKQVLEQYLAALEDFSNALSALVDRKSITVYLATDNFEGKTQQLYRVESTVEMLGFNGGSQSMRFLPLAQAQKVLDKNPSVAAKLVAQRKFNEEGFKETYSEILRRAVISKRYITKKSVILLLWQMDSVWKKLFLPGLGDVNEAYAAFWLINKSIPAFGTGESIENRINDYVFTKDRGVLAVDNISAVFKGDVEYFDESVGQWVDAHIKGPGGSLPKPSGFVSLAQKIVGISDEDMLTMIQREREAAVNAGWSKGRGTLMDIENNQISYTTKVDGKDNPVQMVTKNIDDVIDKTIRENFDITKQVSDAIIVDIKI